MKIIIEGKMKKVFLGFLLLVGILGLLTSLMTVGGCKSPSTPTIPTPTTPECEKNHTAQVTFQNKSATNLTYDVIWDGSKLTTIAPGASSQVYTVSAATHTLQFRITNTSKAACTQSTPVLAQCHSYTYWCTT